MILRNMPNLLNQNSQIRNYGQRIEPKIKKLNTKIRNAVKI